MSRKEKVENEEVKSDWTLGLEHLGQMVMYCRKTPSMMGSGKIEFIPGIIVCPSKNITNPKERAVNINVFTTQGGLGMTKYDCMYSESPTDGRWCFKEDMLKHAAKRS